jgi:UDP-N-acetylmuramoyl-tripeptide--D-alanyl-D-alanine ligase
MSARLKIIIASKPACFSLDAATAERLTGGKWVGSEQHCDIFGAVIDNRQVIPGCLFACIKGEKHDGHDFAATAVGAGAVLVMSNRQLAVPVPVLIVADVVKALSALAREFRRRYDPECTWIGVGGANGKTTTKTLLSAACQAAAPGRVHATPGNLNNHIGVPLTILATPANVRFAIIELGANHPGEIADLVSIAQPHMGVIVSLGPEHLEGFGDLAGVTRSECELFAGLPAQAPALIGMNGLATHAQAHGVSMDHLRNIIHTAAAGKKLQEIGGDAVTALPISGRAIADGIEINTSVGSAHIAILGQHNIANATLAFYAAVAAGADASAVLRGLATTQPVPGRLVPVRLGAHLVLDDTYNANPASMMVGLDCLAHATGLRLAVLGGMGELGDTSKSCHENIGAYCAQLQIPLLTVGHLAETIGIGYQRAGGKNYQHAPDRAAAVRIIRQLLKTGPHTILCKASRSVGLDHVVRDLVGGAVP